MIHAVLGIRPGDVPHIILAAVLLTVIVVAAAWLLYLTHEVRRRP